jgi:hypothetical protein
MVSIHVSVQLGFRNERTTRRGRSHPFRVVIRRPWRSGESETFPHTAPMENLMLLGNIFFFATRYTPKPHCSENELRQRNIGRKEKAEKLSF